MTRAIEEHKAKRPVRPNTRTCTQQEWNQYDTDYLKWSAQLDLLVIDSLKPGLKALRRDEGVMQGGKFL